MTQPTERGFVSKSYSADTVVTFADITGSGRLVATTAGIQLTLPEPGQYLCEGGYGFEAVVDNEATGPIVLAGDFMGGKKGILVSPGQRVRLQCFPNMTSGYEWVYEVSGTHIESSGTYQPTATWTTADPTDITKAAYWSIGSDLLFLSGYITVADGNAASDLTISLPSGVIPPNVGIEVPLVASVVVDGTPHELLCYVDCSSATAATRQLIKFHNFTALTNGVASTIRWGGVIPLNADGFVSKSITETWTTGTPTSITESVYAKVLGPNLGIMFAQWSSADSTGATNLVIPMPYPMPDMDGYVAFPSILTWVDGSDVTTIQDPRGLLDLADNTEANRKATFNDFATCIDNKAVKLSLAMVFPIASAAWNTGDADPTYTLDGTIATEPAGSVVEESYWAAHDGILGFFQYLSATDGNDCTAVTTEMPMKSPSVLIDTPIYAYQYQHTDTKRTPLAFYDYSAQNIAFLNLHKLDNGEATKIYVAGLLPVE